MKQFLKTVKITIIHVRTSVCIVQAISRHLILQESIMRPMAKIEIKQVKKEVSEIVALSLNDFPPSQPITQRLVVSRRQMEIASTKENP